MNGTAGLQVSLTLAGVSSNDIIIAPNLTFVATLNAITYSGAEIALIDVCEDSWQMDVDLLQNWLEHNTSTKVVNGQPITKEITSGKKIGAIMPVYVLGGFFDIDRLTEISSIYGIPLIEDSTEALGSFKKGKHAGTFGLTGVLSFNGNKIISTGGGGMILTDDKDIAVKAKHLTTTAKTDSLDYFHDEVGYNYRLVNVLAAIGVAQMENFESILKRKKEIDALYRSTLNDVGDIKFQENHSKVGSKLLVIHLSYKKNESTLLNHLSSNEIQCRPFGRQ